MKRVIVILIVLVIVLSLAACGSLSSGELIGVWSGAYKWESNNYNVSIQFDRDGTFIEVVYRNNNLVNADQGTYTIDGNKVKCKNSDHSITTYKYSGGKLTNNGHSLSKE